MDKSLRVIPSAQEDLASYVADSTPVAPSSSAALMARRSLLDTISVALAGARHPVSVHSEEYARGMKNPQGVSVWWGHLHYACETAALLNAVAAHALDYDDVCLAWRGHPGAVLWPALFALAPKTGASIEDLIEAFIIGFEVGAQIGLATANELYAKGWHTTATIGTIAAAAACARLMRMDSPAAFSTLGLAIVQCAGTQASFGSMAKPLQAGFAAAAAVRAAQLGAAGIIAGGVLEGAKGILQLHGNRRTLVLDLPTDFDAKPAIDHYGPQYKRFPACYATHRSIEAALSLRHRLDCQSSGIESIRVEGSIGAHQALISHVPQSPDEARFSLEYVVACALDTGKVDLSSFSEQGLRNPGIMRLMAACTVSESTALGPDRAARVTLNLSSGRELKQDITALEVADELALPASLRDKVGDCMRHAGPYGVDPDALCAALFPCGPTACAPPHDYFFSRVLAAPHEPQP